MNEKTIMVVLGSPRKKGNSAALADRLMEGALSGGAKVEKLPLREMTVSPCTHCDACRKATRTDCVIQDDMKDVYPKLRTADALVLAGPVYWFSVSAQTKLFMDRCYALGGPEGYDLKGKRIGIILTYADPDPFVSGAANALRMFQDAYRYVGAEIVGMVYGSAAEAGEIRANADLMEKAYDLGKRLSAPGPAA